MTRVQYNTEDYGRRAFQKLDRLIQHPLDPTAVADELLGENDIRIEERESIGPPSNATNLA